MLAAVSGLIRSLNVTTTGAVTDTPVTPFAGETATAVGPVVSGAVAAAVVKLLANTATALPARSDKPSTCSVYVVAGSSGTAGVNRTIRFPPVNERAPATGSPPAAASTMRLRPISATLIGALTCTCTKALTGTPATPSGGDTACTNAPAGCGPAL